ncbi:MAG: hypothetical protein WCI05_13915 [Myxococcales bacterium]
MPQARQVVRAGALSEWQVTQIIDALLAATPSWRVERRIQSRIL